MNDVLIGITLVLYGLAIVMLSLENGEIKRKLQELESERR